MVLDAIKDIIGNAELDKSLEQLIRIFTRQYVQNYRDRHCTLKTLCARMDTPVQLEDVFTDVQVLERSDLRYFETPDALQELFRQSGRGFEFRTAQRKDGMGVAGQEDRLMVLGGPGVGKSTFLRKIGLEALKGESGQYSHQYIPVFVELKRFDVTQMTIEAFIENEFNICGFPHPKPFTQKALERGKLLVLLDGLDEVPSDKVDRTIAQIEDFVDRYSKNRFIASCRIAAYKGGFSRFRDIAMAAFNEFQIERFIQNWFRSEPTVGKHCWGLLQQPAYAAAKELAQTPLLLTLLCAVYDEVQDLPKKRVMLYQEALDILLRKWTAEKRIQRDPIYKDLSNELEVRLLSEIAFNSFSKDQLFFTKRDLTSQIRDFLVGNLNAPEHLDSEAVLTAIEVQQGIFVERAQNAYSFSHLTFQEYLTAFYIERMRQEKHFVSECLTNRQWREVFLLVAGMMGNADTLLTLMESEAQQLIQTDKLKGLIQWTKEATDGSAGQFKPAAKRTVAIFFALDLARARARARGLDLDLDLARLEIFTSVNLAVLIEQLEGMKSQFPSDNAPVEVCLAFAERLNQTWCTALHLNPEWLDLSEEEVQSLENYLYANELIVRCKEAASYISPQVWGAIESRMLTLNEADA